MISILIVGLSVVFAAAFWLAYLLKPGLRQQIENPKHCFQNQVQHFDQQCHATDTKSNGANSHEIR